MTLTGLESFFLERFLKYKLNFFISYVHVCKRAKRPCGPWPTRLLGSWDSPCKNTGMGHALFQGIFPTQESNLRLLHLLHWQAGSLPLVPSGKPLVSYMIVQMICFNYCVFVSWGVSPFHLSCQFHVCGAISLFIMLTMGLMSSQSVLIIPDISNVYLLCFLCYFC